MAVGQVVVLGPDNEGTRGLVARCELLAAEQGGVVEVRHVSSDLPEDEMLSAAADAVAIIPAGTRALTTDMARRLPRLKLIQTTSAGTDWLDKAALGELGVLVANNGGGNAVAVAEHTIALMIGVYRKIDRQMESLRAGTWMEGVPGEPEEFHNLVDKTIGIVGLGRIGSRLARRLRGWECELLYTDILRFPPELEQELRVRRADLDELLRESDIVSLHVPLDRSTRHMIGRRELELMKPTAVLINACRGPVVDEGALLEALRDGRIFGAGLDVLEQEPAAADNPLLDMPNVIVTPHLAGYGVESRARSAVFAIANAGRVARGEGPESIVPPV